MRNTALVLAVPLLWLGIASAVAGNPRCEASSGARRAPVLELYTSEGCSSCPPADRWLSTLREAETGAVVQAFHVSYWDYIGWTDRFASAAHGARQREIASRNQQRSVYTPQAVLDGRDWRNWGALPAQRPAANASITLREVAVDQFEADITPGGQAPARWSAYWTVTEDGHSSRVRAGENAGALLQHDFVVRQYTPMGEYRGVAGATQKLLLRSIAATPNRARRINLVLFDPRDGSTLQALSLRC